VLGEKNVRTLLAFKLSQKFLLTGRKNIPFREQRDDGGCRLHKSINSRDYVLAAKVQLDNGKE